nr:uncharacterized protein LOC113809288 [Penaeus vannamei]
MANARVMRAFLVLLLTALTKAELTQLVIGEEIIVSYNGHEIFHHTRRAQSSPLAWGQPTTQRTTVCSTSRRKFSRSSPWIESSWLRTGREVFESRWVPMLIPRSSGRQKGDGIKEQNADKRDLEDNSGGGGGWQYGGKRSNIARVLGHEVQEHEL